MRWSVLYRMARGVSYVATHSDSVPNRIGKGYLTPIAPYLRWCTRGVNSGCHSHRHPFEELYQTVPYCLTRKLSAPVRARERRQEAECLPEALWSIRAFSQREDGGTFSCWRRSKSSPTRSNSSRSPKIISSSELGRDRTDLDIGYCPKPSCSC